MKTNYSCLDNFIEVQVRSDSGSKIHAVCFVHFVGDSYNRVPDKFSFCNFDLTPVKFSVFCRSIVNCPSSHLFARVGQVDDYNLELDFELR